MLEILLRKFSAAGKVNEERSDRAVEKAVEEIIAFCLDAGFLGDERKIEEEVFVFPCAEGFFAGEAGEQGFNGVGVPIFFLGEGLDDVVSGLRGFVPEQFHDFPFGFGDGGSAWHFRVTLLYLHASLV